VPHGGERTETDLEKEERLLMGFVQRRRELEEELAKASQEIVDLEESKQSDELSADIRILELRLLNTQLQTRNKILNAKLNKQTEMRSACKRLRMTTPSAFTCPITLDVMTDPVILLETGQTYERSALEEWFSRGKRECPATGVSVVDTRVIPARSLKAAILEWRGE
jgi:hypothetical protein